MGKRQRNRERALGLRKLGQESFTAFMERIGFRGKKGKVQK